MYTNNSGGAKGADLTWDRIGREFGVLNHIHWRPEHLDTMAESQRVKMFEDVKNAAIALKRPAQFKGISLVQRNWFQVEFSGAIFAVSRIINPEEVDFKGFRNKTGKQIVAGGTGWAVEMAIQKGKEVYVFDMNDNTWKFWDYVHKIFTPTESTPILTFTFAGIGSRELTPEGIQAIKDVYTETFKNQ